MSLPAEFLLLWTSYCAEFLQHWTSRRAEFLHAWAVKLCRISALQFLIPCQIKMKKKNRLNILRVKIKDFIVPFLNVQSIMCTLTRFNKQRSKKMNICTSKLYLRLTFRWIIQNVALLKQHIFLIRENWSILLLLHRRDFGVFCLNSQHFTVSGK